MRPASGLAAVALVAALAAAGQAAPQEQEKGAAPGVQGADPALLETVRTIAGRVAALVGASSRADLIAVRAPRAARDAAARARASRTLSPDRAAARGRAWEDLGLGAAGDPEDLVVALARDLDGMGFDADGRELLVDPDRLKDDTGTGDPDADAAASLMLATGLAPDEPVVAHFAAHAALDPAVPDGGSTTDALLARAALSEGAANVVALTILFGGMGLESEVVSGAVRPEDALGGRLVPEAMTSSSPAIASFLQFVYLDGFAQAASLVKAGDFRRLALERGRRTTTRDVDHLDRAPARPPEFEAPRVPEGSGLEVADHDSLGEQGIVTLVSALTGKDNLGLIAGDGWTGDALWRLEAPGRPDDGVTVWQARFATDEDAKDMTYALGRCLTARFPAGEAVPTPDGGSTTTAGGRIYRISRNGIEVSFRVAGAAEDRLFANGPVKKGTAAPAQAPMKHKK